MKIKNQNIANHILKVRNKKQGKYNLLPQFSIY